MSDSAHVGTTIVLSILVVVGILGNSLVCVVIMKNRDMRYIHNSYFVFLATMEFYKVVIYSGIRDKRPDYSFTNVRCLQNIEDFRISCRTDIIRQQMQGSNGRNNRTD